MEAAIASGLAAWGVPGALLLAVGGGFWRLLIWILAENKRREEESRDREMRLMEALTGMNERYHRVTQLLDGLVSSVTALHVSQERMVADVTRFEASQGRLVQIVELLIQRVGVEKNADPHR